MSTYWGYHCTKHNDTTEHVINQGQDVLRQIAACRRELKALQDVDTPCNLVIYAWRMEITSGEIILWLAEHSECPIVLHNEYGEVESLNAPS